VDGTEDERRKEVRRDVGSPSSSQTHPEEKGGLTRSLLVEGKHRELISMPKEAQKKSEMELEGEDSPKF